MGLLLGVVALGACSVDGITFTVGSVDSTSAQDMPAADAPIDATVVPLDFVVSSSSMTITEGMSRQVMLSLTSAPTGSLLATLEASDDTRLGVFPTAVLFGPSDWSTPQAVTLSGKADADTSDEEVTITLRSTLIPNPMVIEVTVDDDDGLALAMSPATLDVGEGTNGTIAVHLTAMPAAEVRVDVASSNASVATVSPTMLVFTPANYDLDQTITVSGMQDLDTVTNTASIDFTSTDLTTASVAVQVSDDDVLGITPSASSVSLTEGTTQTFTVQLTQQPSANVNVAIGSGSTAVATVSPASLTFNSTNWMTPQTVTVTAVADDDVVNDSTNLTLSSAGLTNRTVAVTVTDDDTQGIVTTPASTLTVTEGSTAQLGVKLAYRPAGDVVIDVASLSTAVATVTPATLTFGPSNYGTNQNVTVTGVQDVNAVPESTTIHLDAVALGLSTDVTANVADDDTLAIETSTATIAVTEGEMAMFQVRLTAQPQATTTIMLASDDTSSATVTASLTFTTANWNVYQTAIVTGVQDVDLVSETPTLTLSSSGLANKTVAVNVSDNDTQAITASASTVTVTEGATATIGISLAYMPASTVTVTVSSTDAMVATASATMLTFTPANYATPQDVVITGVDDADATSETTTLALTLGLAMTNVTVNVTDDDALNIDVAQSTLNIGESGTGVIQVRLTAMPPAATTVTITSSDTGAATVTASVPFTTSNWGVYQNVTVTGVADADAADETVTLTFKATGLADKTATVTVDDDDNQAIVTDVSSVAVTEGGTATFNVKLGAQPTATTVVTIGSSDTGAATTAPTSLSFDTATWNTNQLVTVTGVQDSDLLNESVTLTLTAPSIANKTVTANISDNDETLTVIKAGTGTGTVASTPAGISNCGGTSGTVDCTENYNINTSVTLTPTAGTGSSFTGWSGTDAASCTGTAPSCTLSMSAARSVTATFTLNKYTLTVTKAGTGAGTVASSPSGISNCGGTSGTVDCAEDYDYNTSVTLTPTAGSGARFAGWSGACTGTGTCTVAMSTARAVTATFTQQYALTVTKAGTGAGTVASSPAGISNCGGTSGTVDCTEAYDVNTSVTLTPTAAAGSRFAGWSGSDATACTGTLPVCTLSMSEARDVTATFTQQYTLTVTKAGTGAGTVASSPAGISNCGGTSGTVDCTEAYDVNTSVTLTPTAAAGSRFAGWSGSDATACTGTLPVCTLSMSEARDVTATFTQQHTLTVTKAGTGGGTVASSPAGISNCGGTGTVDCTETYDVNTSVTLTPTAAAGARFAGWSGNDATACTGTLPVCTLSMSEARDVTATFTQQYTLTVTTNGSGAGTVASSPAGISNCGGTSGTVDCTEAYDDTASVTLTATPGSGARFAGWSGACMGGGTCTVTMSAAKTVTATFTAQYTLTVTTTGSGAGTVASSPTGISNCGGASADCSEIYDVNTSVTLTPTAAAGSRFAGWSGADASACTGTLPVCTLSMSEARDVTATFTQQYSLFVTKTGTGGGTVASSPAGISNCGATADPDCAEDFDVNTSVTLTPTASTGSTFTGWSGTSASLCTGTLPACTLSMTAARAVTATFTLNQYRLTVTKAGTAAGTVASSPGGISDCGGASSDCFEDYDYNTSVTLTPTAPTGSTFAGWSGTSASLCTGTLPACTLSMTAARAVTATFNITRHTLTVTKAGTGAGTIASNPTGISNCGGASPDCSEDYDHNTSVTLTPTAATGSTFTGWSGTSASLCTGTLPACTLSMTAARAVTATFTLNKYTLTVTKAGTGAGTIASNPTGITNCGGASPDCSEDYDYNTSVTLTPTAATGSTFTGWSGTSASLCTGTLPACTLSMTAARAVTATFNITRHTLTVTKAGTGAGTVGSSPAGISNCGGASPDCSQDYDYNTSVTLTPTAATGSTFSGWSGASASLCTGPLPACTLSMTAARSVTATFTLNQYKLTVSWIGLGTVTPSPDPGGVSCGLRCYEYVFDYGTSVTLDTFATPPWYFDSWSGACLGSGGCSVLMTGDTSVSALFTRNLELCNGLCEPDDVCPSDCS
ncbi:MAG: hypothetical protein SFX73_25985 [Kofleriaceae bacterium]|nr:hypothetical protein [Kofleriaceae bacterium]